ncbi:MAG: peptidylprolyl isomerase [Deltaproteobacteria bacterium]|nr:peptidylprolyl isomerase [Deltaproteobacteria bacterium]
MKRFLFLALPIALAACGEAKQPPVVATGEKIAAKHGSLAAAGAPDGKPIAPGTGMPHGTHGGMTRSKIAALAPDAVVLKVDGQSFTKSDLDRTMAQAASLSGVPPNMLEGEMKDAFEQPAYEKMLERALLIKEAKVRKLWPSDEEAKAATAEMVKALPKDKNLADVLKTLGTNQAAFEADVRVDVAISKLLKAIEAAVPAPPAEAIDKIYEANKAVFVVPDTTSVAQILVKIDRGAGAQVLGEKKKQAEAIKALVVGKDGATFAKVAREQSEDTATKASGGDLGTFKKGDVFPEIEALAFSLKEGQIGGPVQTDRGFHVVRGGGVVKGRVLPAKEAKGIIADREKVKAFMKQIDDVTDSLRKAAVIERVVEPMPSPLIDPAETGSKVPSWKATGRNANPGMPSPHGAMPGGDRGASHP